MRVSWSVEDRTVTCRLRLDPGEDPDRSVPGRPAVSLVTDRFHVELPDRVGEIHPDLLAVAAWTVVSPWIDGRLVVDRGVSPALARAFSELGIELTPVDPTLEARTPGPRPGLSYSGGADSIAVSEVLPRDTPYIHFRRTAHPRVADRVTPRRADHIVEGLVRVAADRGRDVHIVRSDLEFLRLPRPGFPTWAAVGIGMLLLADQLDLGAAGFGTVLGAKFLTNGLRYRGGSRGGAAADLYQAVGLPLLRPATGMTEVATLLLSAGSDLSDLSRSCLIGRDGPCRSCTKCFRKELTMAAIEDRAPSRSLWERIGSDHPVLRAHADGPPWYMQHVLEYVLTHARDIGRTPAAWMLERVPVTAEETTWVTRYYPLALEYDVPQPFRDEVRRAVARRMTMMDADDIRTVETWDAAARSEPSVATPGA